MLARLTKPLKLWVKCSMWEIKRRGASHVKRFSIQARDSQNVKRLTRCKIKSTNFADNYPIFDESLLNVQLYQIRCASLIYKHLYYKLFSDMENMLYYLEVSEKFTI